MAACPPAPPAPPAPAAPDDGSDGNESLSAPSEFLAEFLSAIMRRQYAEALKYCRLILQYEPHNATARGFYPLLRHKLTHKQHSEEDPPPGTEHSEHAHAHEPQPPGTEHSEHAHEPRHPRDHNEAMDHSADVSSSAGEGEGNGEVEGEEEGSEYASSQSSLELDSEPSTDTRDPSDPADSTGSGSGSRWDSSGSSPPDDNGNTQPGTEACAGARGEASDLENDNAPHLNNERRTARDGSSETEPWSSLRRLRARFAAIK